MLHCVKYILNSSPEYEYYAVGDLWKCFETLALAVTLLCATVPLMEVAANENEAPRSVWRLAHVLDKREWYKYVSRLGAAIKV